MEAGLQHTCQGITDLLLIFGMWVLVKASALGFAQGHVTDMALPCLIKLVWYIVDQLRLVCSIFRDHAVRL